MLRTPAVSISSKAPRVIPFLGGNPYEWRALLRDQRLIRPGEIMGLHGKPAMSPDPAILDPSLVLEVVFEARAPGWAGAHVRLNPGERLDYSLHRVKCGGDSPDETWSVHFGVLSEEGARLGRVYCLGDGSVIPFAGDWDDLVGRL